MPLHYVDPHKNYGRWYRALETWSRSRSGQFVARHVFFHVDPWLFRATAFTDLPNRVYGGWSDYLATTAAVGRTIPLFRLISRWPPYSRAKQGLASSLGIEAFRLENFPTTPVSVTSTLSAWIPSG